MNPVYLYLIINAAATFRTFGHLHSATIVRRLPPQNLNINKNNFITNFNKKNNKLEIITHIFQLSLSDTS